MAAIDVLSTDHGRTEMSDFPYRISQDDCIDHNSTPFETSEAALPAGFPSRVQSSMTWTAAELEGSEQDGIMQLTSEECLAIERAVVTFIGQCITPR
jgi:hypothetical protein